MRRHGVLCGVGGLLTVLLAVVAFWPRSVGAQPAETRSASPDQPVASPDPPSPPAAPRAPMDPAVSVPPLPSPAPTLTTAPTGEAPVGRGQATAPTPTLREQLKAENIDALLSRLSTIKTQKAELDRLEKETVAALRDKLKEQKRRMQELGVSVEPSAPPPPPPAPDIGVPTPKR